MCARDAVQNAPIRVQIRLEVEENEPTAGKAGATRHWRHEPKQKIIVSRDLCEGAQLINTVSEVIGRRQGHER